MKYLNQQMKEWGFFRCNTPAMPTTKEEAAIRTAAFRNYVFATIFHAHSQRILQKNQAIYQVTDRQ
jgi:hypothetical protein